jgi:hypothetical protein
MEEKKLILPEFIAGIATAKNNEAIAHKGVSLLSKLISYCLANLQIKREAKPYTTSFLPQMYI